MFPWIIAHRGAMAEAPENTRSAFDLALNFPIDGIEFDVQLSRDGVPVVFHDSNLKKINGSRRAISSYRYEALCQMDLGKWFDSAFSGERLLSLEEVLLEYGAKTRLLVEIKSDGSRENQEKDQSLSHMVPDMIKRIVPETFFAQILILSFDANLISAAMQRAPDLKYGWNLKTAKLTISDFVGNLCSVSLPIRKITSRFVDYCHTNGLIAMTYACNTKKQLDKALAMGVDVIMTDAPGRICSYLDR